jgi:hypothetical protein
MSKKLAIIALLALTFVMAKAQTAVQPIADPHMSFVNAVGQACAGCKLSTFAAGTTTPLATFTDNTGTAQNTNPIILDPTGSANIWFTQASYKIVLDDPLGNTLWTVDNIPAICTLITCSFARPIPLNLLAFGATGNNSTDDTSAFQSAVTAACSTANATGGVTELDIPVPPVAYKITSVVTLCSNLHIHGVGHPTINFTGTGELFKLSGGTLAARNVEIDYLDMEGTQAAATFAIQFLTTTPTTISSLNDQIDHNIINGFGQGASGGCISVQNDSQRLTINNNIMSCDGADILKTFPTDSLHVYDNILASFDSVGGWCIDVSDGAGNIALDGGAGTQEIDHNNLLCDGTGSSGVLRLNSIGEWIIRDNEAETSAAVTNAQNSPWTILSSGFLTFKSNIDFAHRLSSYDFYVANAITEATFEDNSSGGGSTLQADATAFSISSNVATVTAPNSFSSGEVVFLGGIINWTTATYFNLQTVVITSASSSQYTFAFTHANVATTSDVGSAQGMTFFVGNGTANTYRNNLSGNSQLTVYSNQNYIGIEGPDDANGKSFGCVNNGTSGFITFCNSSVVIESSGPTQTAGFFVFAPNVGVGVPVGMEVGINNQTNNSGFFQFNPVGGIGSNLNTITMGLPGELPVTIDAFGDISTTATGKFNTISNFNAVLLPGFLTGHHGTSGINVQLSDGTGASGILAAYAADGSVTSSGVAASASSTMPSTCTVGEIWTNPSATSASTVLAVCFPANTFTFVAVP